ncbi:MAG: 2-oxoacid:acceptor oxidoreductase family protein [Candidatus Gastranaerophilales bacterium]|nr:2-oxoacid:acceptor oxidoreductase family protein [Candidatus Gastranaerophilales bacterium]
MDSSLVIAGFGGQGVLLAGQIIAKALMLEGLNISWLPAYGAEMRGGTVNCTVSFSDDEVASAYIEVPENVIALNLPSFERFESQVKTGGTMLVNSSLVDAKPRRKDINYKFIPLTEIANKVGEIRTTNVAAIGAFFATLPNFKLDNVKNVITNVLKNKKSQLIDKNLKALQSGYEFIKSKATALAK